MTLRETMARHARTALTRPDHLGETVTYRFKSGAADREVRAVVRRLDLESDPLTPQTAKRRAILSIPVDDVEGITTVVNGDKVILAMRLGAETSVCRVRRIVSQNAGMFRLEVEE